MNVTPYALPDEISEAAKPMDRYEAAWVCMVLAVIRGYPDGESATIKRIRKDLVSTLEWRVKGADYNSDTSSLWATLDLAQSEFSPMTRANKRADKISRNTGVTVEKAYMQVLFDDPELYAEIRTERLHEARIRLSSQSPTVAADS